MEELTTGKGTPREEGGARRRAEARRGFGFCGIARNCIFLAIMIMIALF